jgi:hypothetical protein
MTEKKPANTQRTGKRGGKTRTSWKPGQSGNPNGRAKDGESWAKIIKDVGDMYRDDLIAFIGVDNVLGKQIMQLPPNVQMKYLVTARVFAALMFEPTAGLWNGLMDRAEGKVPDKLQVDGNLNVADLEKALEKTYGSRNDPG